MLHTASCGTFFVKKNPDGFQVAWCVCAQWRGLNCNAWLDSIIVYHIFVFSKRTLQIKHSFYSTLTEMQASHRNKACVLFSPLVNVPVAPFHQYIHWLWRTNRNVVFRSLTRKNDMKLSFIATGNRHLQRIFFLLDLNWVHNRPNSKFKIPLSSFHTFKFWLQTKRKLVPENICHST